VRIAAGLLLLATILQCSGCVVVAATVASLAAITATTVKTAGKVTVAAVSTTGGVAAAAITSSGEVTALTMESAAKLTKAGMVVMVDGSSGALVELPWQEGMKLYQAAQSGEFTGSFNAARIFREGRIISGSLRWSPLVRQRIG